ERALTRVNRSAASHRCASNSHGPRARASPLADLAQNFRRMFAKARGGPLRRHGSAADDDRRAHPRNLAALGGRARPLDAHAAVDDLRIGENLVEGIDRSGWNPNRFELLQQVATAPTHGQRREPRNQLVTVSQPIGICAVARLLGDFRLPQHHAEFGELAVVAGGDDDVAVRHWENLIGHDIGMRIADALGHLTGDEIIERLVSKDPDLAVDQRGIHLAATAGAPTFDERGENAHYRIDASENVGDRDTCALGFAVQRPSQVHDPTHALGHEILAGACDVRAGLAKAGDRAIDQPRIVLAQTGVIEAELREPADLEIFDQYVRACRQLLDDAPAILALEIKLDRAFAAVGAMEIGGAEMA